MDGSTTLNGRRIQPPFGYALVEGLAGLLAAGWRGAARLIGAFAESQRRARARDELTRLSDRMLRDIGLERSQIDRLFR
jgi:uncharacterized protein YjiS (DUF1127 family)